VGERRKKLRRGVASYSNATLRTAPHNYHLAFVSLTGRRYRARVCCVVNSASGCRPEAAIHTRSKSRVSYKTGSRRKGVRNALRSGHSQSPEDPDVDFQWTRMEILPVARDQAYFRHRMDRIRSPSALQLVHRRYASVFRGVFSPALEPPRDRPPQHCFCYRRYHARISEKVICIAEDRRKRSRCETHRTRMLRVSQRRRRACLGDYHGAAVVIARCDKTRRHIVA
jgi:hypothetical protein